MTDLTTTTKDDLEFMQAVIIAVVTLAKEQQTEPYDRYQNGLWQLSKLEADYKKADKYHFAQLTHKVCTLVRYVSSFYLVLSAINLTIRQLERQQVTQLDSPNSEPILTEQQTLLFA